MKKKILFLVLLFTITLCVQSQNRHGRVHRYERDMFGVLKYNSRDNSYKATFTKNIFDDWVYEDNSRNKLKYTKKFLDRMGAPDVDNMFGDLIRYFRGKNNEKEEFEVDIFDNLKYSNNHGFKASLSKNVFEDIVYEDSNGNKIEYEKKFIAVFQLRDISHQNAHLFMDMFYSMMEMGTKALKEKYRINVFDRFEYENNDGVKLDLEIDHVRRYYTKREGRDRIFLWDRFYDDYLR